MKNELIESMASKLGMALKEFHEGTGAFIVTSFCEITAQMQPKNFADAFGNQGILIDREMDEFPYQKELMVGSIRFFCLLTEEEAKEVRDERNIDMG